MVNDIRNNPIKWLLHQVHWAWGRYIRPGSCRTIHANWQEVRSLKFYSPVEIPDSAWDSWPK